MNQSILPCTVTQTDLYSSFAQAVLTQTTLKFPALFSLLQEIQEL